MLIKNPFFWGGGGGGVAKECYLTCKQKQLSQTILIKIQQPLFWDQHSAVPLRVTFQVLLIHQVVHGRMFRFIYGFLSVCEAFPCY